MPYRKYWATSEICQFLRPGFLCTMRFLVCIFEGKARPLQWLVFFRRFNAIGPLFVHYALLL